MIKNRKFKVKIAKNAGFCFGVRRAINLTEKAIQKKNKVYTLGPIIHNPQEVERLKKQGIKILKESSKIKKSSIILRTHGIPFNLHKKFKKNKNINLIDATCPFVKRTQNIVKQLLDINSKEKIIIIGEKNHPEVIALKSYGKGKCVILENCQEAQNFKRKSKLINIVSQTTQTTKNFRNIVKILKKKHKVKVYNTICQATLDRQKSAKKLARNVDLMIVIGGKNSGNTTRLSQICEKITKTYHIEVADDIQEKWFQKVKIVGVTAGASTPNWIIKNIEKKIKELAYIVNY
ncbi:MAG: 4-hydroxy-3-methylbut-2-enyl diphosphate reductase [Endomicrobium sp.]|nr:4-hydroxy-3-methylbut-2-enyl diphosphate reductase [Endomicrobium sp.]